MSAQTRRSRLDNVDWSDRFSYIREMYDVPAKLDGRVKYNGEPGTIIGTAGPYLEVRLDDGDREPFILHPTWRMEYL